jgi:hypothetical protein
MKVSKATVSERSSENEGKNFPIWQHIQKENCAPKEAYW